MRRENTKVILMNYLENAFTEEDIKEIKMCLAQEDILLELNEHKPRFMNGIDELFAQIQIFFSPEIMNAIGSGILTNGIYDVLKNFLTTIYIKMKSRFITILEPGGVKEQKLPNIHIIMDDMKVSIPLDIEKEQYEYFVDKLFENQYLETIVKNEYCVWNKEEETLEYYSYEEMCMRGYKEKKE